MGLPAKHKANYGTAKKPPGVTANQLWKREVSRRKSAMRKRAEEKAQASRATNALVRRGYIAANGALMGAVFAQTDLEVTDVGGFDVHAGVFAAGAVTLGEMFMPDLFKGQLGEFLCASGDAGAALAAAHYAQEVVGKAPAPADDA